MGYESLSTVVVLVILMVIAVGWLPRRTVNRMKKVAEHRQDRYSSSLHLVDADSGTRFSDEHTPQPKGAIMQRAQTSTTTPTTAKVAHIRELRRAAVRRRRILALSLLLITVLVLVLAEGLFLYYSYNDLYGGVERAVENRFSTVVGRLQATGTAGDTATTAESRANVLRRVVEQFDEKDKFEFMLLDAQGVILATSSGTMNRDLTNGTDYGRALTSANGIGSAIFTTPQGERVMAVTMLVPYAAGSIAALRMVTSLTLIDGQWWRTVAICVGLGVLVLAFTVWSGLFFVRSIVRPLGEVEATATKIAKGDMKVRLPDTRYDDEIGRLCKTINQMAEDLAETERLKNEFISSVSHELRTPLTSIRGWVETIGNIDDPTNENYRRGLSIIGTETDRLYTMVEEPVSYTHLTLPTIA